MATDIGSLMKGLWNLKKEKDRENTLRNEKEISEFSPKGFDGNHSIINISPNFTKKHKVSFN